MGLLEMRVPAGAPVLLCCKQCRIPYEQGEPVVKSIGRALRWTVPFSCPECGKKVEVLLSKRSVTRRLAPRLPLAQPPGAVPLPVPRIR